MESVKLIKRFLKNEFSEKELSKNNLDELKTTFFKYFSKPFASSLYLGLKTVIFKLIGKSKEDIIKILEKENISLDIDTEGIFFKELSEGIKEFIADFIVENGEYLSDESKFIGKFNKEFERFLDINKNIGKINIAKNNNRIITQRDINRDNFINAEIKEKEDKQENKTIINQQNSNRPIGKFYSIYIDQSNAKAKGNIFGYVQGDVNITKERKNLSLEELKKKLSLSNNIIGEEFLKLDRKYIVGRNKDIEKIKELLNKYEIINIWGIAGIGKTTLAKAVLNEINENFNHKIIFVLSNTSKNKVFTLKEKLIEEVEILLDKLNVPNYLKILDDLDERYKEAIKILNDTTLFKGTKLVILDNILAFSKKGNGQVNKEALEELFSLDNTQFILTSRQKLEGFPYVANYYLEPLSLEDSLKLFFRHYQYKPNEEEKVKELIKLIQRNTFFIEILAKTLAIGDTTLEELIKKAKILNYQI